MISHIGVSAYCKEDAEVFFKDVLGLQITEISSIDADLAKNIFGVDKKIDIVEYSNGNLTMEVFITGHINSNTFSHLCIKSNNRDELIEKCIAHNIKYNFINREDVSKSNLLFIRDLSENLYEIY